MSKAQAWLDECQRIDTAGDAYVKSLIESTKNRPAKEFCPDTLLLAAVLEAAWDVTEDKGQDIDDGEQYVREYVRHVISEAIDKTEPRT